MVETAIRTHNAEENVRSRTATRTTARAPTQRQPASDPRFTAAIIPTTVLTVLAQVADDNGVAVDPWLTVIRPFRMNGSASSRPPLAVNVLPLVMVLRQSMVHVPPLADPSSKFPKDRCRPWVIVTFEFSGGKISISPAARDPGEPRSTMLFRTWFLPSLNSTTGPVWKDI